VSRFAHLEIHKEELSFSAGHFTIFSATEREHLHGHNYNVHVVFHIKIETNGLSFDYRFYKKKIAALCEQLDRRFLLPNQSPYLRIDSDKDYVIAHFNQQKIPFPKEDVIILPLINITIEELSRWFLEKLTEDQATLLRHNVHGMIVNVYNGSGQSGGIMWGNNVNYPDELSNKL